MSTFHAERPTDLRRSTPWHRLSHIVAELPRGLQDLAGDLPRTGRILDYGSAEAPYRRFFAADADFVTADLPGNPDAALVLNEDGTVPEPDAAFDVVLSTQVLEHVTDPAVYLAECFRVLKPGGRMLLSTHGLMVYHPDPVDYWRWTSAGLQRQVELAGFRVARFEGIMGLAATGLQLVQDAVYWKLPKPLAHLTALILQTLIKIADRMQGAGSKRMNALVYGLVAVKPHDLVGPKLIAAFADAYPEATFVEIGSNDGDQHDHLRPHILANDWAGIMVEPVPYVFDRLRANYADQPRVQLANCAIADADGTIPFYHLVAPPEDTAGLPDWYDGIGSLSREAVLTHAAHFPDLEERLVESEVACVTYATLLQRHGVQHVDLILLDTEGMDWHILQTIDLAADPPRMVVFEHYHLSAEDRAAAHAHLRAIGYETLEEGFDTFAVWPADDALSRAFRAAAPSVPGIAKYEE